MPEPTTDPAGSVPEVRPHPDRVAELLLKLGVPDVQTAYEQAHQLGHRVWELTDTECSPPGSVLEQALALLAADADDVFRREQWRAAYHDAANRLAALGIPKAESALRGVVNGIDLGALTPWADQPAVAAEVSAPSAPGSPVIPERALLDSEDELWWPVQGHEGHWRHAISGEVHTRTYVDGNYGPVREVLLVPLAAGKVLELVEEWAEENGVDDGVRLNNWLRAAVEAMQDAMVGDRPEPRTASRGVGSGRPRVAGRCPACRGASDAYIGDRPVSSDKRQSDTADPPPAKVLCGCGVRIIHATADGYGRDGCDDPTPDGAPVAADLTAPMAAEVVEYAIRWREADRKFGTTRESSVLDELAFRVDLLVGADRPTGRPGPDPEPVPEPDSVPGWGKAAVQDLIRRVRAAEPGDGWYESKDGDGALLDAVLYDAESYQRAAARHQRALEERDAARAELAEVTADRKQLEAHAERLELEVTALRDSTREMAADLARLRRELERAHRNIGDVSAVLPGLDISRSLASEVREALATARRDAGADALEWAAGLDDRASSLLMVHAKAVRSGARTIPVSEPAEDGDRQ